MSGEVKELKVLWLVIDVFVFVCYLHIIFKEKKLEVESYVVCWCVTGVL